tara:strand:- start:288 stop:1298 length:1011 start_codon:yes stop_codon:yes gene_type:complete
MKNRYDGTMENQTAVRTGTVVNHDQQHYTETVVSGGGGHANQHGGYVEPVTSTTHHHHKQDIWYQDDNGSDHSLSLHDTQLKINTGHGIAILRSNKTRSPLRVANLNTRLFWRVNCDGGERAGFRKILDQFSIRLKALFIAAVAVIPYVSAIGLLIVGSSFFSKRHFQGVYTKPKVYGLLYILCATAAIIPIADDLLETRKMGTVIPDQTSINLSGSTVRTVVTAAWYGMQPFANQLGANLPSRDELRAELAAVPEIVQLRYQESGGNRSYGFDREVITYDRTTRDVVWGIGFSVLAFLFMYLRRVTASRIDRGVSAALDRRIRNIIAEASAVTKA